MHFQVAGKPAKAFGKYGDVNAPDELMAVVDIVDQNAGRIGSALLLGPIGHAEVEVPFRAGLGGGKGGDVKEDRDQYGQTAHGGNCMSAPARGQGDSKAMRLGSGGRRMRLSTPTTDILDWMT